MIVAGYSLCMFLNFDSQHLRHWITGHPICNPHYFRDWWKTEIEGLTSDWGWKDGENTDELLLTQIDQRKQLPKSRVTSRNVHSLIFVWNSNVTPPIVVHDCAKINLINYLALKWVSFDKWQSIHGHPIKPDKRKTIRQVQLKASVKRPGWWNNARHEFFKGCQWP